jgi:hypothetical protein
VDFVDLKPSLMAPCDQVAPQLDSGHLPLSTQSCWGDICKAPSENVIWGTDEEGGLLEAGAGRRPRPASLWGASHCPWHSASPPPFQPSQGPTTVTEAGCFGGLRNPGPTGGSRAVSGASASYLPTLFVFLNFSHICASSFWVAWIGEPLKRP